MTPLIDQINPHRDSPAAKTVYYVFAAIIAVPVTAGQAWLLKMLTADIHDHLGDVVPLLEYSKAVKMMIKINIIAVGTYILARLAWPDFKR